MAGMTPDGDRVSVLLSSYLDGELSDDELHEVVRVLETDLDAIAEFRRLQAARRSVRTLPLLALPVDLLPGSHPTEELSAYLDGELATGELPSVVAHLRSCGECRAELADLDRSRTAVRSLPGIEPPVFLDTERSDRRSRSRRVWPAAAIAGGVAAAALAFTIGTSQGPEPASVDLADLQSRHTAVASVPSEPTGVAVSSP
jgi:anti-sigma factor RsiW